MCHGWYLGSHPGLDPWIKTIHSPPPPWCTLSYRTATRSVEVTIWCPLSWFFEPSLVHILYKNNSGSHLRATPLYCWLCFQLPTLHSRQGAMAPTPPLLTETAAVKMKTPNSLSRGVTATNKLSLSAMAFEGLLRLKVQRESGVAGQGSKLLIIASKAVCGNSWRLDRSMLWLAVEANRDGTGLTSGRVGMIRLPKLARVTRARGSIKSIKNVEYMIYIDSRGNPPQVSVTDNNVIFGRGGAF